MMSEVEFTPSPRRINRIKTSNARIKETSGVHSLIFAVIIVVLAFYFLSALNLKSGSIQTLGTLGSQLDCKNKSWENSKLVADGQDCPSVDEIVLDIQNIEASVKKNLIANIRIWPAGEYGSAIVNTGFTSVPLSLGYESLNLSTWLTPGKSLIGGRTVELPLGTTNQIQNYPFDSYSGEWSARLSNGDTTELIPTTLTVSNRPVYGWNIKIEENPNASRKYKQDVINNQKIIHLGGKESIQWSAHRSASLILASMLLVLVMILGVVAAIWLTVAIALRRRPPSIDSLSWLATSLFALVQIRGQFPGNPPQGIKLDSLVTYPVTALLLFLIVANTYMWINRDDWNMENHDFNT